MNTPVAPVPAPLPYRPNITLDIIDDIDEAFDTDYGDGIDLNLPPDRPVLDCRI